MTPRAWFRFDDATTDPSTVDLHIIDFIAGWEDDWVARNWGYDLGVSARAFVEQLAALEDGVTTIRLHINSPGGDVQAAVNIANALREQRAKGRTVETYIDGIAASAASIVAMAGERVVMADNALMMIHNPYAGVVGNASELRAMADVLDTVRGQIVATYQWHSDESAEDLAALMDAETWLNADEAISAGLATEKVQGLQAAATISVVDLDRLHVPAQYRDRVKALLKPVADAKAPAKPPVQDQNTPEPAAAVDVLRLCREAECLDLAEALIADRAPLEQVTARVGAERARRTAAAAREREIRALCHVAHQDDLAEGYVRGQMTPEDVSAHLTLVKAKLDGQEIDATLGPTDKGGAASWESVFNRIHGRKAK
jgi:ATP-dependent protease ClpP protease subunit